MQRRQKPNTSVGSQSSRNVADISRPKKKQDRKLYTECVYIVLLVVIVTVSTLVYTIDEHLPDGVTIATAHPGQFVEERARVHLDKIVSFGNREVGSVANEILTRDYIMNTLTNYQHQAEKHAVNNIEVDLQMASGSFNLAFLLDGFTSVYGNVTNVIVRVGPRTESPNQQALMVNAHFDSAIQAPGASDDATSCAVMLEVINILSVSNLPLKHSVVFLFNGAEETVLQAAHGFITKHKWSRNLAGFVNLEAAGSGGKEVVFQSGPDNPWLIKAYAQSVPHPFGSVIAQEIFQSGIIPSDTDFRIFRDHGHIPGLDLAYFVNGYRYHTRYDLPQYIPAGSIQRAGDNLLALVKHLTQSDELIDKLYRHGNMAFFDLFGVAMVTYPMRVANIYAVLLLVCVAIYFNYKHRTNMLSVKTTCMLAGLSVLTCVVCCLVTVSVAVLLTVLHCNMSWFTNTYLCVGLYVLPTILTTIVVMHYFKPQQVSVRLLEESQFNVALLFWATSLAVMIVYQRASSYLPMLWVAFPLTTRYFAYTTTNKGWGVRYLTALCVGYVPAAMLTVYSLMSVFYMLIPIFGRSGNNINPDIILALILTVTTHTLLLYLTGVVYVTEKPIRVCVLLMCVSVVSVLLAVFTPVGFPYTADTNHPTPQRLIAQHVSRRFYSLDGSVLSEDSGLWLQPLDYNGIHSLKQHQPELLSQFTLKPCHGLYCNYPFFLPIRSLSKSLYSKPSAPIQQDTVLKLDGQTQIDTHTRRYQFHLEGDDHMNLYVEAAEGNTVTSWSFSDGVVPVKPESSEHSRSSFIVICRGVTIYPLHFWIDITTAVAWQPGEAVFDIAIANHHIHGDNSMSAELKQFHTRVPDWMNIYYWQSEYIQYKY